MTHQPPRHVVEPAPTPSAAGRSARQLPRLRELDALRGLALCGILFVNIIQITHMPQYLSPRHPAPMTPVFGAVFEGRFFPIFSFLFGLSFAIFLRNAGQRATRPRLVLLRRLGFLAAFGFAHHQLQPGEALLPYAVCGLVFLLPASYLPRRLVLIVGSLGTIAGVTVVSGGVLLIPGLFLLGMATTWYGVPESLNRRGGQLAVLFGASTVLALAADAWHFLTPPPSLVAHKTEAIAGLLTAIAYATGLLLLLRTPLRRALSPVLEPLGRMALTNYLTATLIVLAADRFLHLATGPQYGIVIGLAFAITALQAAFSAWWLSHFRYGPGEWLWRCLTWWQPVPIRPNRDMATSTA